MRAPPGGERRVRIGPYAAFDLVGTLVGAYAIARATKRPFLLVAAALVAISVPAHALAGQDTALLRQVRG